MSKSVSLCCLLALSIAPALGQNSPQSEVEQLQTQIQQLKEQFEQLKFEYEQGMATLEQKLTQLKASSTKSSQPSTVGQNPPQSEVEQLQTQIQQLKEQFEQLKFEYEQGMATLEQKLTQLKHLTTKSRQPSAQESRKGWVPQADGRIRCGPISESSGLGVCAAERFLAIVTTTYCGCAALRIDMEYRIFSAAQTPSIILLSK